MDRRRALVLAFAVALLLLLLPLAVYFLMPSSAGFEATRAQQEATIGSESETVADRDTGNPAPSSVESGASASEDFAEPAETEPIPASIRPQRRIKDIVGTSDCQMLVRSTSTQSMVLISIPNSSGSGFILLDDERVVSEGQLPFIPRRMSLGLPEFTAPLVAFSAPSTDVGGTHHLRVFRGSGEIFSGESIMDYGLAKDGASYFVVEPLAGDSAHLRVRNFSQGSERQFDLDQIYVPDSEGQPRYHAAYSLDETEIQLIPFGDDLERSYRFFPVHDGTPRRVEVRLHTANSQVLFASSEILYMVSYSDDETYAEIIKYSSPIDARWKLSQEWKQPLHPLSYTGRLSLAEEGEIIVVHGDVTSSLFRTSNGDMLIAAPMWDPNIEQELGGLGFEQILKGFQAQGAVPDSGLVQRNSLMQSNALIGIFDLEGEMDPSIGTSLRLNKLLDSEDLGDTNRRLQIPSHGFPTHCRVADSSFAGVSATAAELSYSMR